MDRPGAVHEREAHLREPRRRHLLPQRHARDPRVDRGEGQHHVQDPVQRRGRDDRRTGDRRLDHRAADHAADGRRRRAPHRRRDRRTREIRRPLGPVAARDPERGRLGRDRDRSQVEGARPAARQPSRRRRDRPSPRRARPHPARAARDRGRHGHHLRPDLRVREAAPPEEDRRRQAAVPRSRQARLHQRPRLRRLRRLLGAVELPVGRAARDRVRAQARHQPVVVQQGLLVREGLLPELRHGRGRPRAQGQGHGGGRRRRSTGCSTCRSRRCRRSTCRTASS